MTENEATARVMKQKDALFNRTPSVDPMTAYYATQCQVLQDKLDALNAAVADCLPDLIHYVNTHGPGPDKRLDALRVAVVKAGGRIQ